MKVQTAEFDRAATAPGHFIRDGMPQIAFVGRSNVGKSTMLNRLLGRKKLARISSRPGRTQTINYFLVNRRLYFVDLPGFGYARAAKEARRRWAEVIDQYLRMSEPAPLVVHLVDSKVGATTLDEQAAAYFTELELPVLTVATKIDRVPRSRRSKALAQVRATLAMSDSPEIVPVSALSGEGIGPLWHHLSVFLESPKRVLHTTETT